MPKTKIREGEKVEAKAKASTTGRANDDQSHDHAPTHEVRMADATQEITIGEITVIEIGSETETGTTTGATIATVTAIGIATVTVTAMIAAAGEMA